MSRSKTSPDSELVFRLPRHALRILGIAFGLGVLLAIIVIVAGRDEGFYRPPPEQETATTQEDGLPTPLAAGEDGASGMEEPRPVDEDEQPTLVETPPLPPAVAETPVAPVATAPAATPSQVPSRVGLAPGDTPVPLPGQSPPPVYPPAPLRSGIGGTVMVRAEVDAHGTPVRVSVESSSRNRDLDRAAQEAVRKWRFQPAQRDGQPVAASIVIPVDFKLER